MAGFKVDWSNEARHDLKEILDFYISRNGNAIYSKKLYSRISKSIKLLVQNPLLGRSTDEPMVRALITGDYQILYEIFNTSILIIMVWDSRRDPDDKVLLSRKK